MIRPLNLPILILLAKYFATSQPGWGPRKPQCHHPCFFAMGARVGGWGLQELLPWESAQEKTGQATSVLEDPFIPKLSNVPI